MCQQISSRIQNEPGYRKTTVLGIPTRHQRRGTGKNAVIERSEKKKQEQTSNKKRNGPTQKEQKKEEKKKTMQCTGRKENEKKML